MEGAFGFVLLVVLAILVGPWIAIARLRHRVGELENDFQRRFENVFGQLNLLNRSIDKLQSSISNLTSSAVAPPAEPKPAPPSLAAQEPSSSRSAEVLGQMEVVKPSAPPPPPAPQPVSASISAPTPTMPYIPPRPIAPPLPVQSTEQIRVSTMEVGIGLLERLKGGLNLEEALGTNWLNKLGVIILVFGIAFFLAFQLQHLGPAGKAVVGYFVSLSLLGCGIWLETKERYRLFARAGIGGGWALTFFTTYAMYHVQAAKVLQSQSTDLVLLLFVAALMVAHTLRYDSQVVTGLAFLLAFSTVTISNVTVYSLSAGAILAVGLVVVVLRRQWYELEVFGILAAYLNHWLWLRTIIEPMGAHKHAFPEFFSSAGLLIFYWLVFRVSYVFRKVADAERERVSTVAALLNSVLVLALLKYQSIHPEWAFYALLVMGAVELAFAHTPQLRARRFAFAILGTLGSVAIVAAIPFRFSGANVEVLWLALAEALILAGVFAGEILFRRLGYLACVATFVHMIGINAARVYGVRMDDAIVRGHYGLALVFTIAVALFYWNAYWVPARWPELFKDHFERRMEIYLSIIAALAGVVGLWVAFPQSWAAMAWGLFAMVLAYVGDRTNTKAVAIEAVAIFAFAFLRAVFLNMGDAAHWGILTHRLVTVSILVASMYLGARWSRLPWIFEDHLRDGVRWAASFLAFYLIWYELRPVSVAVGWAVFAIVLLELGIARHSLHFRLQAYTGLLASFLRLFFVNLNAGGELGTISPRVYTTVPVILMLYYAYWRMTEADTESLDRDNSWHLPAICSYMAIISLAGLIRFEIDPDWVAPAWGTLVILLMALTVYTGRHLFEHQAILIGFGAMFRGTLHNLYERSNFPGPLWHSRWLTVGVTAALLFAALVPGFQLRELGPQSEDDPAWKRALRAMARRPEQVFFFAALLLVTILLGVEMRRGMVTVSWGLLGVIVFLFALWVKERSYRLAGLALLLLCVGKILIIDIWGLRASDRYITLIVLGLALLLVSFLYSRYREAIRQYL
jgi:hypothetical protein